MEEKEEFTHYLVDPIQEFMPLILFNIKLTMVVQEALYTP